MTGNKHKRVLLTGGSRGIGSAIKVFFEENEYEVIAPTRDILDLSSIQSIETYTSATTSEFDVLVNNAGINPIAKIDALSAASLNEVIAVDLVAPILLMKFCAKGMIDRGYGRIVNISSIWGSVSKEGRGAYSAAKAGLEGITRTAAVELGSYGIIVNAVAPGFVATELTRKNNSEEDIQRIAVALPLKRLAQPSEIARFVGFLSSEENSFITGQTIRIDGGYSCL